MNIVRFKYLPDMSVIVVATFYLCMAKTVYAIAITEL